MANEGFLFTNLVDFDQLFGHRNDVQGFYQALRQFDAALPGLLSTLREEDLLSLRNFGRKSLDEIKEKLVQRGFLTQEELTKVLV